MQANTSLFFIGGFRSGTTLLINLLGLHEDVSAWFEAKFLVEALRWMRVIRAPEQAVMEEPLVLPPQPEGFSLDAVSTRIRTQMLSDIARMDGSLATGKASHEKFAIGADRILFTQDQALSALATWQSRIGAIASTTPILELAFHNFFWTLANYHLEVDPAPLLVNKTPEITRFGKELRKCVGQHKTVMLIRDGRQVALSSSALGWADATTMANLWCRLIIEAREAAVGAEDDYLEIRYEDLISNPVQILNRVCSHLGIAEKGSQIVETYEKLGIKISNNPYPRTVNQQSLATSEFDENVLTMLSELGYVG